VLLQLPSTVDHRDTIFNSKIKTALPAQLSTAAINAGLPASSLSRLILAFTSGNAGAFKSIPGVTPDVIAVLTAGSRQAYADSFRYIWSRELDMACPNATRHSKASQHELNLDQFHNLLRRQLDRSHTHAIGYLGPWWQLGAYVRDHAMLAWLHVCWQRQQVGPSTDSGS